MDYDKTYLFDLLYDDPGIRETPGERTQDQVERLHQAIDRWGRTYQPTDYSGLEILIARGMEKDTIMSTQAIDLETRRLYDGGGVPPWAIRFLEPVGPEPLKEITMTFRVEKNRPPPPFRPEEFRTTQHLGGLGLANMRHPAFERPLRPAKVQENLAAVKVTTAWTVDTSPQAVDRQARFRLALASVLPKGDVDLPKLAVDLERPLSELRMVMTVEPYGILFRDVMDRTRHPGYSLSLRVSVSLTDPGSSMADIRRAFVDTLRAIAFGHVD